MNTFKRILALFAAIGFLISHAYAQPTPSDTQSIMVKKADGALVSPAFGLKIGTGQTVTFASGSTLSIQSGASFTFPSGSIPWGSVNKTGSSLADLTTRNFSDLQNKPTTLAGYGITDAQPLDADLTAWSAVSPSSYSTTAQIAAAYQPLDADLTSIAANATGGFLTRTAANTYTPRTITGTVGQITVTNGDGVSGAPTISLPSTITQATTFSDAITITKSGAAGLTVQNSSAASFARASVYSGAANDYGAEMFSSTAGVVGVGSLTSTPFVLRYNTSEVARLNSAQFAVTSTTDATNTTSGALQVAGGGSFQKALYVGGNNLTLASTAGTDSNVNIFAPTTTNAAQVRFYSGASLRWYIGRGAGDGSENFRLLNGSSSVALSVDNSTLAATFGGNVVLQGGGTLSGSSGAVTMTAGGTNQNITLTPSGTGRVDIGSASAGRVLRLYRGGTNDYGEINRTDGAMDINSSGGTFRGIIRFQNKSEAESSYTEAGRITAEGKWLFSPSSHSASSWTTSGALSQFLGATVTNNSTAASGTVASAVFHSFAQPTLAATNTGVTTTDAATVYIAGSPAVGTNQTITNRWGFWNVSSTRFDEFVSIYSGKSLRLHKPDNTEWASMNMSAASRVSLNYPLDLTNNTTSTSTTTGALTVTGGVGVGGAQWLGTYLAFSGASVETTSGINVPVANAASKDFLFYGDGTRGGMLRGYHDGSNIARLSLGFWASSGDAFTSALDITQSATLSNNLVAITGTAEATTGGAGSLTTAGGIYAAKAVVANRYESQHSTLTYSATTNLDFTTTSFRTLTLSGDVTFTTSNLAAGRTYVVRILPGASSRNLTFPAGWVFLGSAAPSSVAANKTAVLSLTAFGTANTDVVASYAVQP